MERWFRRHATTISQLYFSGGMKPEVIENLEWLTENRPSSLAVSPSARVAKLAMLSSAAFRGKAAGTPGRFVHQDRSYLRRAKGFLQWRQSMKAVMMKRYGPAAATTDMVVSRPALMPELCTPSNSPEGPPTVSKQPPSSFRCRVTDANDT